MRHLSYKSVSFARKSVPIHSETSDRALKAVTLPFSTSSFERIMTFRQDVMRLSRDSKADSKLRLVFLVNLFVDSGLTRLRHGDGYCQEPRKSDFSM